MAADPEVYSITEVSAGTSQDQRRRQATYLVGMGMRTFCFVGAVIAHGTLRWLLIAGAILLPYFCVVLANAGRERGLVAMPTIFGGANRKAISPQKYETE
ncbi:MAG: DUF3099 domain-containing protein [Actinomycetales bacterium]|nr:DUF3099 domain-containing protein [Actinomycetales bacterium]